jgi:hypothetical protein
VFFVRWRDAIAYIRELAMMNDGRSALDCLHLRYSAPRDNGGAKVTEFVVEMDSGVDLLLVDQKGGAPPNGDFVVVYVQLHFTSIILLLHSQIPMDDE